MILRNPFLSIDGTDVSTDGMELNITLGREQQDPTTFGDLIRMVEAGLKTCTISLRFEQNFDAGEIDSILYGIWNETAADAALVIRPSTTAASANNPQLAITGILTEYSPFGQSVGDFVDAPVTFAAGSDVTRTP